MVDRVRWVVAFGLLVFAAGIMGRAVAEPDPEATAEPAAASAAEGPAYVLPAESLDWPTQHDRHAELLGADAPGFNRFVLAGVDRAQRSAMDGGGYFIGVTADPPESPMGYAVSLFGRELVKPARSTSYCSGSSYTAFIEAINLALPDEAADLDATHYEALRMQEPDGGRREDGVKFWGHWNADGFGNHFALVQYGGVGEVVDPQDARPGDFMNISWKNGGGHSTVFLGYCYNAEGQPCIRYWSSQGSTHGMSDCVTPLSRVQSVMIVRATHPEAVFTFDPAATVQTKVPGMQITWPASASAPGGEPAGSSDSDAASGG